MRVDIDQCQKIFDHGSKVVPIHGCAVAGDIDKFGEDLK